MNNCIGQNILIGVYLCSSVDNLFWWLSFLAGFAEEGGAGSVDGAADWVFASVAGFSFFAVDGEFDGEVAGIAVGIEKITQCGAAGFDTFSQYFFHFC